MKVRKILCENERTSVDPSLSGNGAQVLNSIVDWREGLQPSTSRQGGWKKNQYIQPVQYNRALWSTTTGITINVWQWKNANMQKQ